MPDKYTLVARIYPAVICLVPVQILFGKAAGTPLADMLDNVLSAEIAANVGVGAVLLFLFMNVNRYIGKELEKRIFKDELSMPTTEMLLPNNSTISPDMRRLVSEKLEREFRISLPSSEDVQNDEAAARRRIVDAVALIRHTVGSGTLLIQHNIEYGFARNIIGGAPISFVASVAGAWWCFSTGSASIAVFLVGCSLFFLFVFVFRRKIIQRLGELYARRLIHEYV